MEESRHGIVGQARSPAAASIAGASSHQEGGRAWERVLSEAEVDSLGGGCSEAARSPGTSNPGRSKASSATGSRGRTWGYSRLQRAETYNQVPLVCDLSVHIRC